MNTSAPVRGATAPTGLSERPFRAAVAVAPRPSRPPQRSMHRPKSRGHVALSFFAFSAAAAFVLVTVVDPYSGATASPYFQVAGATSDRYDGQAAQSLSVFSTVANTVTIEGYTVVEPEPEPEPEPVIAASVGGVAVTPGSAQAIAAGAVAARGWGNDQFNCLVSLWQKESNWRVDAANSSSGAYGIPQSLPGSKMASAGADWQTNPATQIAWGLGYISGRYGTPCGAWGHSVDVGWY